MTQRRIVLFAAVMVVLGGTAALAWRIAPRTTRYYTDADTIHQPLAATPPRDVLWQPPRPLAELVDSAEDVYEPKLSWDGLSLFFVRGKAGANADVWVARRTPMGWSAPEPLNEINSAADELGPTPSFDGTALYFYSDRAGGVGGYDLWMARRDGERWLPPTNLGAAVNTEFNEYAPALAPAGATLCFSSNRPTPGDARQPNPDPWPATVREDLFQRTYDLYAAPLTERGVGSATALALLNTPFNEGPACFSPAGDFLYFASDRPAGQGGFDLYRARLLRGVFQSPENLGSPIDTPWNELDPGVAALGFALYFSSDAPEPERADRTAGGESPRTVGEGAPRAARGYRVYYTSSREVFVEAERDPRPPIDWAGLWSRVGPSLLWALLSLLLLLLLLALGRDLWRRRLSLLARCLLASLMAHLLLMMLMGFWKVTAGVLEALHGPGLIEVALVPSAAADTLATQLTDVAFDVAMPPAQNVPAIERPAVEVAATPVELLTVSAPVHDAARDEPLPTAAPIAEARAPAELQFSRHIAASPEQPPTLDSLAGLALPAAAPPAAARGEPAIKSPAAVQLPVEPVRDETWLAREAVAPVQVETPPPGSADLSAADASLVVQPTVLRESLPHMNQTAAVAPSLTPVDEPARAIDVALPPAEAPSSLGAAADSAAIDVPCAVPGASERQPLPPLEREGRPPMVTEFQLARRGEPAADVSLAALSPAPHETESRGAARAPLSERGSLAPLPAPAPVLRLPVETAPPAPTFAQRAPERREELVERMGGSPETEAAVRRALAWLAAHQSADGRWDGGAFDAGCGGCGGATSYDVNVALTGLATLCFLGAGHTHMSDNPYRTNVDRALRWLVAQQQPDGDLRTGETMYSHGIAAIALSEALGMTSDSVLAGPVHRAAAFIASAQNRRTGGWRYDPGDDGDTSVLGWQMMALKSAQLAGVPVSHDLLRGTERWLERVEARNRPGLFAYRPGEPVSAAMTAEAMFVRQLLGAPRDDERMRGGLAYLAKSLPRWRADPNTYGWYYTTLALFHHQGHEWERWNAELVPELLRMQANDGAATGSWPPEGEWAAVGGRVYQTAICTLMLEVYYRYLPLYATPGATTRPSARFIVGAVTDAASGRPLAGARVRVDRAGPELLVVTDAQGRYALPAPADAPEHFALTAEHDGYVPASVNIRAAATEAGLVQDFALAPRTAATVVIEAAPEVHHLGNDRFQGRVNSQFQKASEGRRFRAAFELTDEHLVTLASSATPPRLHMLTRGVQCPHELRVNGVRLAAALPDSPEDGSFGEFVVELSAALLRPGENDIRITAVSCRGDLDDFEFVNLWIELGAPD